MKIRESDLRNIVRHEAKAILGEGKILAETDEEYREIVEDAFDDKRFRDKARKAFQETLERIRNENEIKRRDDYYFVNLNGGMEVRFGLQSDKGSAYYGKENSSPYIRLNGILYSLKFHSEDNLRKDLIDVLERKKKDFIHEYIHYLDDRRSGHDFFKKASEFGSDEYYREDEEVNAYFQQALSKVDDVNKKFRNFRNFKEWFFESMVEERVVQNITKDQRKRLIKRLYDYWKNVIGKT